MSKQRDFFLNLAVDRPLHLAAWGLPYGTTGTMVNPALCAWSLPVTCQRTVRPSRLRRALRKLYGSMFCWTGDIADRSFVHCENRNFRPFSSLTLSRKAVENNLTLNSTIAPENDVNALNSDVAMCRNSRYV